uniref:Solute carrier family 10 member 3 n=1 Tax=Lates calcarifer TaxID=8187 RepID=A0A4W6EIT9_LATCA
WRRRCNRLGRPLAGGGRSVSLRRPTTSLSVNNMRTLFTLCCLFLITGGADRAWATGNLTVDSSDQSNLTADSGTRYIRIGDGSSQEFEFPENTNGVIVISSQYRSAAANRKGRQSWKQTVKVRSLDPEVLSILNVTDSGHTGPAKSYIISIRSGFPGRAQLQIQLLDLDQDSVPVLIEERTDYSIRVAPGNDDPATRLIQSGGLSHFSENPCACAFGCKVEVEVLRGLLKSPVPLLLGVLGQFLVMPLYAYCVSRLASLPKPLSLGLVITCSAPGGGGGYLYSLLLGGDVTLAISMTLVSTVVAAAAMPLSSALYGRLLGVHAALHVPFVKILGTLLFIAIPISLGMLVKLRLPALTRVLLALIRPFSFVLIIGGIFMAYQMGASILANVRPQIVAVGVTVPLLGLVVGAVLAKLAGLAPPQRKTVSIEVGVQNSLLALAVMQLSFRRAEADFASQMLLIVLGYFAQRRLCGSAVPRSDA